MTRIIILAAGKGTRMDSELPKVLVPLNNRPMILYLMDSVIAAGVDPKPLVVVSPDNKEIISRSLSACSVEYAIQDKQLGTGHAVNCARSQVGDKTDKVIVLYGDQPFLTPQSIIQVAASQEILTVMPTQLPDFEDWRHNFWHLGRIIRTAAGEVEKIVEFKDASEAEQAVTEINTGFMAFNRAWLFDNLDKLKDDNNKHEYYLTDMVKIAFNGGHKIGTINIESHEAVGINSMPELKIAENLPAD